MLQPILTASSTAAPTVDQFLLGDAVYHAEPEPNLVMLHLQFLGLASFITA